MLLSSTWVQALDCPEKVFTQDELTEILSALRKQHASLPKPFASQRVRVDRNKCMYFYYEYDQSGASSKKHTVFTFDHYGELVRYYKEG